MSLPLRSRYSMMLLASRRALRSQRPCLVRFATHQASSAGARQQTSTPPPSTAAAPETPEKEAPRFVYSETNPDPQLYRKVPGSKLVFEPEERPEYDKSKPFYAQKLNADDKILWTFLLSLLALIPAGYWWYGYRKAWVAEKRERALKEYLEQHPEHQHLADKAAAEAAAKAAV